MPRDNACDCCGRPHAPLYCENCDLRLCEVHHECPECEEGLTHPEEED